MSRVYHDTFVVTFTITPGAPGSKPTITKDDDLVSYRNGPVVWVVCNYDSQPYTVEIDYGKITHRETGKLEHPLGGMNMKIYVDAAPTGDHSLAAGVDLITKANPKGATDHYDYKADLYTHPKHEYVTSADPDLEVVEPFPFRHPKTKKAKSLKRRQSGARKRHKPAKRR